ncbi:MAG: dephospho-CoA kinase [Ignavibacteria bacterium]|nr:dephospho-CoA kinase [Ignavibacteria bacterium]
MRSKVLIAVTGGMGSGKSLASEYLMKLGHYVISADKVTHELYKSNRSLRNKLIENFGKDLYSKSGRFSKSKARKVFFSDRKTIEKVNNIVHPYVIKTIDDMIRKFYGDIVFVESAIVFESSYYRKFDYILLIYADKKIRLERVIKTRKLSREVALRLMSYQMSDERKLSLADFVIYNNSTKKEFFRSIKDFSYLVRLIS